MPTFEELVIENEQLRGELKMLHYVLQQHGKGGGDAMPPLGKKTMKRAQFEAQSPVERMQLIRDSYKLVD